MKNFDDRQINIWGFKFPAKTFILTFIIACAVLLFLVLMDTFVTEISWYGVIIGSGFLVALCCAMQLAENRGLKGDYFYDVILWVFPLSIVGARTYYVLNSLDEFSSFYEMIAIWNGGMAIYGGVIGGLIGVIICSAIHRKNVASTTDVIAPCLILAQAIGRWGNFVNQEVYGMEVTNKAMQWFPFAVKIDKYGTASWHLATFFYESVLNFIGFIILTKLLRKTKTKGVVTCAYLMYYGAVRFVLEGLRENQFILKIPGTNWAVSKVVSLAIMIVGAIILTILLIKAKENNEKNQTTDLK